MARRFVYRWSPEAGRWIFFVERSTLRAAERIAAKLQKAGHETRIVTQKPRPADER